jgi:hypothetical protein
LAERQPPPWENIRAILEDGFKAGLMVCPFPTETLLETAPCRDRAIRLEIEMLFSKVSAGYRFRDFGELVIDNTLALIRSNFEIESLEEIDFHGWAARDDIASSLKQYRECRGFACGNRRFRFAPAKDRAHFVAGDRRDDHR